MTKRAIVLLFLIAICLGLTSCSKQDKSPEGDMNREVHAETGTSSGIMEETMRSSSGKIDNLFGFSASCEEKEELPSWYTRKYILYVDGEEMLAAQTFGLQNSDYFVDIDGDGKNELISNCMWGGDGHEEVYVFRYNGEYIEIGFVNWLNLDMKGLNYWGVNAVQTHYDDNNNVILLKYADRDTLVEIPIETDSLEYSRWLSNADMPFIDIDAAFEKFGSE